jgi:hypothetical protein
MEKWQFAIRYYYNAFPHFKAKGKYWIQFCIGQKAVCIGFFLSSVEKLPFFMKVNGHVPKEIVKCHL